MLTVYPSNRLEDLAELLFAVLDRAQVGVLASQQVIVESQGMQHWLQMQQAQRRGIAMNLRFPMPARFLWETARSLLHPDPVPTESPYAERVLSWRIDALLQSSVFTDQPDTRIVTAYWKKTSGADDLRRYQLASRIASVFEQYIMYRPDWLTAWEQGQTVTDAHPDEAWQAHLWRLLVEGEPNYPGALQRQALACLPARKSRLPEHIFLFGINALPQPTLEFFQALGRYTHVHIFHLNPCVDYWGDVRSDRQRLKTGALAANREAQWQAWLDSQSEQGNPLLANLGQQGKAFFNLLQQSEHFEISAFDDLPLQPTAEGERTVLAQVQADILHLHHAGLTADTHIDNSLRFNSSHGALREIQALHDYLLHQFQRDETLTPRDVVVMCPEIERYAPYIDSVFRRPRVRLDEDDSPRLPCSIADRIVLNDEPMIAAFVELLQLPDSRFEVSGIFDYVRLPAMAARFGFAPGELDVIEHWLREASVHWGLNAEHKDACAGTQNSSAMFTWQWGLERLLRGFAQGDHWQIAHGQLLLPMVEGQQAVLLGRVMHLLEQLQNHARLLMRPRTGQQWQSYLQEMKAQLFDPGEEDLDASRMIDDVIHQLGASLDAAGYPQTIGLPVVRSFLTHHFSQPDTGNQFMTGQVTFCSMVPMRSIPFRVVAVLGLNDGEFPRQSHPVSFDLLSAMPARPGDRSRRADDRYLFLETLISARDQIYLSFQGRDIKNNNERQPSLVLKELMYYLQQGYGWDFSEGAASQIHQQPLQPFSAACYDELSAHVLPGFNQNWCRLINRIDHRQNDIQLAPLPLPDEPVELERLVRFFADPLKSLAQERLQLHFELDQTVIEDAEPFAIDKLLEYQARDEIFTRLRCNAPVETVYEHYRLSGRFPESPATESDLLKITEQAELLDQALQSFGETTLQGAIWPCPLPQNGEDTETTLELYAELPWLPNGDELLVYRPAACKPKDEVRMWLLHLVATVIRQTPVTTRGVYLKKNPYKGNYEIQNVTLKPVVDIACAEQWLKAWVGYWWQQGLCRPTLVYAPLGQHYIEGKRDKDTGSIPDCTELALVAASHWSNQVRDTLASNAYFDWFFDAHSELPLSELASLVALYHPLYEHKAVPEKAKGAKR